MWCSKPANNFKFLGVQDFNSGEPWTGVQGVNRNAKLVAWANVIKLFSAVKEFSKFF